jgi:hypothetical protein
MVLEDRESLFSCDASTDATRRSCAESFKQDLLRAGWTCA